MTCKCRDCPFGFSADLSATILFLFLRSSKDFLSLHPSKEFRLSHGFVHGLIGDDRKHLKHSPAFRTGRLLPLIINGLWRMSCGIRRV